MKFRRRSTSSSEQTDRARGVSEDPGAEAPGELSGPFDVDDLPGLDDGVERVDLGSLLMQAEPGRDLRLQVDEASGTVQSVLLAGVDGAMDVRAFAASRNGDLWGEVRPQIVADMTQRGGTAVEQEGRFGPELLCEATVRTPDGQTGVQQSRIVGINGPRWMVRATFIGRPAREPESAGEWEDVLARVVVRRGGHAVPPGEALPVTLPEQARRVEQPDEDPRSALSDQGQQPVDGSGSQPDGAGGADPASS